LSALTIEFQVVLVRGTTKTPLGAGRYPQVGVLSHIARTCCQSSPPRPPTTD